MLGGLFGGGGQTGIGGAVAGEVGGAQHRLAGGPRDIRGVLGSILKKR